MLVWRLTKPRAGFATAMPMGTTRLRENPCSVCELRSAYEDVPPLVIEWYSGSSRVGDFMFSMIGDAMISPSTVELLRPFGKWHPEPVTMTWPMKPKRGYPLVTPESVADGLFTLESEPRAGLDLEASTVRVTASCDVCGVRHYEVDGVEDNSRRWDPAVKDLVDNSKPRIAAHGLYFDRNVLGDVDIFRPVEFPRCLLVTDRVRDLILNHELTNVAFLEFGEIH